ncbi:MAG: hypothetical protein ACRDHW_05075 [Ktedonobacteraceae bacterium]
MQGRQGPGTKGQRPLDRSATAGHRFSDLTGRQPVIPQRPPGMARTRINQSPVTPRVARPQRQESRMRKPRTLRGWSLLLGIGAVAIVLVGIGAYALTNFVVAVSAEAGPANAASGFLSDIQSKNYDDAYNALSATATVQLGKSDFAKLAQKDDHCYGPVTNYSEVDGSATSTSDGTIQSFAFAVTRSQLNKPYNLTLTLQKDAAGDWEVTSFGSDLGPAPPTCK